MADPASSSSLDELLQVAQESALLAGATIREAFCSSATADSNGADNNSKHASRIVDVGIKSSNTDLVTETDQQCERIILERIQKSFPNHKIIGEESSGSNRYELTNQPTWTVDPIDGTTNFVHGLKLSCTIISYLENKEVLVGVIYDPYADELFWAIKGQGAFLQARTSWRNNVESRQNIINQKISCSSRATSLDKAVISMDPGYGRDKVAVQRYCSVQSAILLRRVRNIRVIGCTGLNMAYVACGRLDAGFEEGSWETNRGPKIWDFAAGRLLVEEAGGITLDLEQKYNENDIFDLSHPLDLLKRSFFCAANPGLAKEILEAISEGKTMCDVRGISSES